MIPLIQVHLHTHTTVLVNVLHQVELERLVNYAGRNDRMSSLAVI